MIPKGGGQYPTGQLYQASHLEMRVETQMVRGPAGGHVEAARRSWALPLLPWAFLLPSPFPWLVLGDSWLHVGGSKPLALLLITVGLPAVQSPLSSTGLQLWGGGRMLGEVPQVTEQTAPSPPQHSRGWRETRFWFLRLHEHTEVHVLP